MPSATSDPAGAPSGNGSSGVLQRAELVRPREVRSGQAVRRDSSTRERADLLSIILDARDPDTGEGMTNEQARDELITFMITGFVTATSALGALFHELSQRPDVERRLHAELAATLDGRPVTDADLPRLAYAQQVMTETLRLYAPTWFLMRRVIEDMRLGGLELPVGTELLFAPPALHRDPAVFTNPMVFDPDRFSPENVKARNRWEFLPFLGGGRPCIGEHFARLETTLAMATIVRALEIRSTDKEFRCEVPFTTVADGPIPAHVSPRT